MTNREFFEAVQNGTINADVQAHATAEINKMNARNEKRATTPSKTAVANEPLKVKIAGEEAKVPKIGGRIIFR